MILEAYKDTVATVATLCTIVQFLSGTDICRKVIRQGSTGDVSGFPFICGVFSTSMWFTYGWLLNDSSIMITNGVGLFLQLSYLLIYIFYCKSPGSWSTTRKQLLLLFIVSSTVFYYVISQHKSKSVITHIGLLCCMASISFYGAPLVTIASVIRFKSTESLPFPLIASGFVVSGLWWLYGIIIQDGFVIYPNFLGFCLASFQLLLFGIYPTKKKGADLSNSEKLKSSTVLIT